MRKLIIILATLLLCSCSNQNHTNHLTLSEEKAVYIKNIDGDTITVLYNDVTKNVRLIGVDTPESKKNKKAKEDALKQKKKIEQIVAQGKESSLFMSKLIKKGDFVYLEFDKQKTDKYNRLLAYVYSNNTMINSTLIKEGYAYPMTIKPNIKYAKQFKAEHLEAVKNKKGLYDE